MKKIIIIIILASTSLYGNWEKVTPHINSVSNIYYDNGELFISVNTRFYKSTDKGDTWKLLNQYGEMEFSGINDVLSNKNKIFAANNMGIYSTIDEGLTWELDTVRGLQPGFVDIIKNEDDLLIAGGGKLFLSSDNGNSWEALLPKNFGVGTALAVDGENIYVGGYSLSEIPNFKYSYDYGKTWAKIEDSTRGLDIISVNSIGARGNEVYIGSTEGCYISRDKGQSFEKSNDINLKSSRAWAFKGDRVYVGTNAGLYYSTDKGRNWEATSYKMIVTDLCINGDEIYLASGFNVGVSTDNGETWTLKNKGLAVGNVSDVTSNSDDIIATAGYRGILLSNDGGNSWRQPPSPNYYMTGSKIAELDSTIFLAKSVMTFANDYGSTWTVVKDSHGYGKAQAQCIVIDYKKRNAFVGDEGRGIFVSGNLGHKWTNILDSQKVYDIRINEEEIYAAAGQNGIFISNDYGESWNHITEQNGLPETGTLKAMEYCNGNLLVGASYSEGIFLSKDKGESWLPVSEHLSTTVINSMTSFENYVFAGTSVGMIFSTDSGENWTNRQDDWMNHFAVSKVMVYKGYLFAATREGLFKALLSDFTNTGAQDYTINRNYLYSYPPYPIPAINKVKSLFYWDTSIDMNEEAIEIYDFYGNKLDTRGKITIDRLTKNSGVLTWECASESTGIYLIRISHGDRTRTLKVMVNK